MKGAVANSTAAEMQAVCNALFIALRRGLVQPGDRLLIQTDCVAAIQAFEGQRRVSVPHEREAVRYFHSLRLEQSLGVSFKHVKGHSGRQEARFVTNHLCDKRARQGMRQARATMRKQSDETEAPVRSA